MSALHVKIIKCKQRETTSIQLHAHMHTRAHAHTHTHVSRAFGLNKLCEYQPCTLNVVKYSERQLRESKYCRTQLHLPAPCIADSQLSLLHKRLSRCWGEGCSWLLPSTSVKHNGSLCVVCLAFFKPPPAPTPTSLHSPSHPHTVSIALSMHSCPSLYLCTAVHRRCQCPPEDLGTSNKSVKAT